MKRYFARTLRVGLWSLLVAGLWSVAAPARALDPDSPEVKQAIDAGIAYLELAEDNRLGARALVGLTMCKTGRDHEHPKVKDTVAALVSYCKKGPENLTLDVYSTGVCLMFLVAVDPSRYREEIDVLAKYLHRKQKPPGAWGYPPEHQHGSTCDTSMTQYAVLGLWEAEEQAGVITPPQVWEKVATWLIQTQAPDGGHPYQGEPSRRTDERVKQSGVKDSMTVAGVGSLYIIKDRLGLGHLKRRANDESPEALQPFETQEERAARVKTKLDPKFFVKSLALGNGWIARNYTVDSPKGWLHYYMYALERYESLKEADNPAAGTPAKAPTWYQQGAKFLIKTQNADGSWLSQSQAVPDTCFAILFLARSTKKGLERTGISKYRGGVMAGGRGLPQVGDVRVRGGEVVVQPLNAPLDQVLTIVKDPRHPQYVAAREALADLAEEGTRDTILKQAANLNRLARAAPQEIRVLAVRTLQRSRDLDQVPLLIELLNDPDVPVALAAQEALRTISRRFSGTGLGTRPTPAERTVIVREWTDWYATIRPEVSLEGTRGGP